MLNMAMITVSQTQLQAMQKIMIFIKFVLGPQVLYLLLQSLRALLVLTLQLDQALVQPAKMELTLQLLELVLAQTAMLESINPQRDKLLA